MCAHFCYRLMIDGEVTLSFMRTIEGGHQGFVSEASCSDCIHGFVNVKESVEEILHNKGVNDLHIAGWDAREYWHSVGHFVCNGF